MMTVTDIGATWVHVRVDTGYDRNDPMQIARAVFAVERGTGAVVVGSAFPSNLGSQVVSIEDVTVTGLHTGSTYDLWTAEVLPSGYGPAVGPVTAVIGGPAAAVPVSPSGWWARQNGGIDVHWLVGFDGGSPVTAVSVVATDASGAVLWWGNESPDVRTMGIDQIDVTNVAFVTVLAWNSVGVSEATPLRWPGGPPAAPSPVEGPRYSLGKGRDGAIDVIWGPSNEVAGHHVIAYAVVLTTLTTGAVAKWANFSPTTRSASFSLPADCTPYVVNVYAWTSVGLSLAGPISSDLPLSGPRNSVGVPVACA
jgi:hypothetical protein